MNIAANPRVNVLNNSVIIEDETLVAPVVVEDVATNAVTSAAVAGPAYVVLAGIRFSHFLNDTMQSLIASVDPVLKESYSLDYPPNGLVTLAVQVTTSLLR